MAFWEDVFMWLMSVIFTVVNGFGALVYTMIYGWRKRVKLPPVTDPILMMSAQELISKIRSRKLRCEEVLRAYIARIDAVDPIIHAVVYRRFEEALSEAVAIDQALDRNPNDPEFSPEKKPLLGLPISVKEAFGVKDCPNTGGLVKRRGSLAKEDAVLITRVRQAGALPLCLTNTSELCMWWETSNHLYGRTDNAYDPRRIVGGSSGGEGALLGAGGSVVGVGSDIGGSIRMPCHFNGVFGHKATTGMVSNEGQYPIADGDAVNYMLSGPMCRYSEDLLPLLKVMSGEENCKQLKLDTPVNVRKVRYYYLEEIGDKAFTSPLDREIRKRFREVLDHIHSELGCKVEKAHLPRMRHALQLWSAKMTTSGQTSFCCLLGDGEPINPWVQLVRWIFGTSPHTLPAILLAVLEKFTGLTAEANVRFCGEVDFLRKDFQDVLCHVDASGEEPEEAVFLMPIHPTTAPYHNQALLRWGNFAYTAVFNVLGFPATAVPLGLTSKKLPFALQVVGDLNKDYLTIAVARHLEKRFGGWVEP